MKQLGNARSIGGLDRHAPRERFIVQDEAGKFDPIGYLRTPRRASEQSVYTNHVWNP